MLASVRQIYQQCRSFAARLLPKSRYSLVALVVFGAIVAVGTTVIAEPAFAQLTDIGNSLLRFVAWLMLIIARLFISFSIFALDFFIELAKYNGFIDTSVVVVGWVMVRDIANMFFVVALLMIAFATILGFEKYEWKKLLGKLLLAALFINFSKMIAGLFIDISHVIMMTFLNAISATAGGNLVNMFKLDKMLALANNPGGSGIMASGTEDLQTGVLMASIVAVIFSACVMMTMLVYAIIMMYRMVILWVLIILSPLAYILQVMPSQKAQGMASEYWGEFSSYIIVGPIMVFFMWLSFATLGAGDIAQQIQLNVDGSEAAKVAESGGSGEQPLTLSEVSSWENMASLLIALTLLWVGLDRVKKTGVEGSGLVDSAQRFTKNVATVATGARVAQWGGRKVKEGGVWTAKQAGYRMPVIGGAAWQERGAKIAGRWKASRAIAKEKRAQTTKKAEGALKEVLSDKNAGFLKKTGAWAKAKSLQAVWEPAERKAKRAKDWQKGAELAQERMEDNLGTSSSSAGQFKQRMGRRAASQEQVGSSKKPQKEAQMEQAAFDAYRPVEEKIQEELDMQLSLLVSQENARRKSNNEGKMTEAEERKFRKKSFDTAEDAAESRRGAIERQYRAKAKDKNIFDLGKELQGDARIIASGKAKGESIRETLDDEAARRVARQKDAVLLGRGETPVHEAIAEQEITERTEKRMGALNFTEMTNAGQRHVGDLVSIRAAANGAITDENLSELQHRSQLAASGLIVNAKKGSENFGSVLTTALTDLKDRDGNRLWTEGLDPSDLVQSQRALFTMLVGRYVKRFDQLSADLQSQLEGEANAHIAALEADGALEQGDMTDDQYQAHKEVLKRDYKESYDLGQAQQEFEQIHGKEGANTILRRMQPALLNIAKDGMPGFAGILSEKEIDPETQRIQYRPSHAYDPVERKGMVGKQNYMSQEATMSQITSITDMFKHTLDGAITGVSDRSKELFETTFGSMTKSTRLHSRLVHELNSLEEKLSEGGDDSHELLANFRAMFEEFSDKNAQAAAAFLEKSGSFGARIIRGGVKNDRGDTMEGSRKLENVMAKYNKGYDASAYSDPDDSGGA